MRVQTVDMCMLVKCLVTKLQRTGCSSSFAAMAVFAGITKLSSLVSIVCTTYLIIVVLDICRYISLEAIYGALRPIDPHILSNHLLSNLSAAVGDHVNDSSDAAKGGCSIQFDEHHLRHVADVGDREPTSNLKPLCNVLEFEHNVGHWIRTNFSGQETWPCCGWDNNHWKRYPDECGTSPMKRKSSFFSGIVNWIRKQEKYSGNRQLYQYSIKLYDS